MPRTPKTVRIEDLREKLGEERVEELLREIAGGNGLRRAATRITRDQLDRTLALVNGEAVGNARRAWIGTVPVFRAYFAESAQRRRFFNEWARRTRETLSEGAQTPRRRRRAATSDQA